MGVVESNPRWVELSLRLKLSRLLRVAAELLEEEQPISAADETVPARIITPGRLPEKP